MPLATIPEAIADFEDGDAGQARQKQRIPEPAIAKQQPIERVI